MAAADAGAAVGLHSVLESAGASGRCIELEPGRWPESAQDLESRMGIGGIHWVTSGGRYRQRSKTTDYLYFTHRSYRPLFVNFVDGVGMAHKIKVDRLPVSVAVLLDDQVTSQMLSQCKVLELQGEAVKRLLVDPRATVVSLRFSYEPEAVVHSHGIRVDLEAYELEVSSADRRREMADSEESFWRSMQAQVVSKGDRRRASLRRHCTLEGQAEEQLDQKVEMGRALLHGALFQVEGSPPQRGSPQHGFPQQQQQQQGWPQPDPWAAEQWPPQHMPPQHHGQPQHHGAPHHHPDVAAAMHRAEVGRMLLQEGFRGDWTDSPTGRPRGGGAAPPPPTQSLEGRFGTGGHNTVAGSVAPASSGRYYDSPGGRTGPPGYSAGAPAGGGYRQGPANPFGQPGPARVPAPAGCVGTPWQTVDTNLRL